jgi:ATP-dependent DNA helicase RecG
MVSLIPEESLARLEETFGRTLSEFSKHEVQALVTAEVEGSVDNARMRQICSLHPVEVTRLLQGLVAKGALHQEGQARWSRYRLSAFPGSEHKAGGSEHKAGGFEHKGGGANASRTLWDIAASARQHKRLQPDAMERIILELCRGRWLSRNELAELLNRHPDGLRQRFLNPMVGHGILRLRYPDKPNRADQAYSVGDRTESETE